MADLVKAIQQGYKSLSRKDDDSFDRLSNRYTIAFLLGCSMFIATKSYVGDPIDCFTPKEFADNWVKYTDNYCWIKNTYFVPIDDQLPVRVNKDGQISMLPDSEHAEDGKPFMLTYYQWVPIILTFMIAVYSIPVGFWGFSMKTSGYDVESIVKVANSADNLDPEKLDKACDYLVAQLARHIDYHRNQGRGRIPIGNKYGRYLFIMYILTKLLYIAVPIFLLFCLTWMMGEGYADYGVRAINGLLKDGKYIENPMFPRVTMCDFRVRRMGENLHRYTTQCVLTVNLFNEKVFLVIWWWLAIVASISVLGLLIWLMKTMLPNSSVDFITKFIQIMEVANPKKPADRDDIKKFANEYLSLDGVFCMRLLAQNLPDVVAAEIVTELFKKWRKNRSRSNSDFEDTRGLTEDIA